MKHDLISYLRRVRPNTSREEVAAAAEVSTATLTRRNREGFDAGEVIRVCRAFSISPVEALVDLGYLTPQEVGQAAGHAAIRLLGDRELLEEMLARALEEEPVIEHRRRQQGLPPLSTPRFERTAVPDSGVVDALSQLGVWANVQALERGEKLQFHGDATVRWDEREGSLVFEEPGMATEEDSKS